MAVFDSLRAYRFILYALSKHLETKQWLQAERRVEPVYCNWLHCSYRILFDVYLIDPFLCGKYFFQVNAMDETDQGTYVTAGVRHVKFWHLTGTTDDGRVLPLQVLLTLFFSVLIGENHHFRWHCDYWITVLTWHIYFLNSKICFPCHFFKRILVCLNVWISGEKCRILSGQTVLNVGVMVEKENMCSNAITEHWFFITVP